MTEAVASFGIILRVAATTAATTATVVLGGLTDIPPPGFERDLLDATAHDSPNGDPEFIAGRNMPIEISGTLNWTPGNATDDMMQTMAAEKTPRVFMATMTQVTPNRQRNFKALIKSFKPTGSVDGVLTGEIVLQVTGTATWTDAA